MYKKLLTIYHQFKKEVQVYRRVLRDPKTPRLGKLFLGLAVGYFFLPFDLIPDFVPVIGHLDDAIIVPLCLFIAFKLIPTEIIQKHRRALR